MNDTIFINDADYSIKLTAQSWVHIKCECGLEITLTPTPSMDLANWNGGLRCPNCGAEHIVIRSDGNVGIAT